jgi:hypothetical protein
MKKQGYILLILILSFLLVQCSSRIELGTESQNPRDVITITPNNQQEIPSRETKAVPNAITPTLLIASPTVANQIYTITPEPKPGVSQNCLNILPSLPEDQTQKGVIILLDTEKSNYLLYNLGTGKKKDIPGSRNYDLVVSPNQKLYAYQDGPSKKLLVFSSNDQLQRSINWENDWGALGGWQNNEQIILTKRTDPSKEEYPRSLMVLNPFSGEKQILQPNYPNIENASFQLDWEGSGTTIYDPIISRVVYPGFIEGKGMGYILFDIKSRTKLAELQSPNFTKTPKWLSDGSKYIVNARAGEFFVITRDGEINQISHMNPEYDPRKNEFNYESSFYSWSPDGKYLALWLLSYTTNNTTLAILDISNGGVTDFCIPHGPNPLNMPYSPIPIWSPDSKALVVEANFRKGEVGNDVILIDLIEKNAVRIDQNFTPVGWLALP